jgi:4-O-beta-D-mannosyl-D-glucose phosphorylase
MGSLKFNDRLRLVEEEHAALIKRQNIATSPGNGIYTKYKFPVLTAAHTPIYWRYDLNKTTNPYLMERFGINAVFNAGAIKWQGKYVVCARVEGSDRKSFFAMAESDNGIDNFRFWEYPCQIPENEEPDTNTYDMRLVSHEDGWIYGLFCTERKDPNAPNHDTSSALAQCGIVRTRDLVNFERLPDLVTPSNQQRNVVLHPEFVRGKYALYTRPQDGFIDTGKGGGIAIGYTNTMEKAVISEEHIIHSRHYHTIYEVKNGQGPAPIKTEKGWLHLAHGVRNTASGLRYVLYLMMTDLNDVTKITHLPGGYFMAPDGEEGLGDVANVLFSNGWLLDDDDETVFIYYGGSDTRLYVATTTLSQLVDYTLHTPEDGFSSIESVATLTSIIEKNKEYSTAFAK